MFKNENWVRHLVSIAGFILMAVPVTTAQAQTQRGGVRVVDALTGQPVATASLIGPQGQVLASATIDGMLPAQPEAGFVLAPGYKTHAISQPIAAVIALTPLTALLPEALAQGMRPATFAKEDVALTGPRGVAPMGQGQAANLGQDIPFLIQQTPSAVATSDAGAGIGYTSVRIRGTDATRTNVTLDGVPVNDAESQGTFWVNLPDLASSLQKVTVVRGVGSSSSGPGAFGAGLLLQTRQPSDTAFVTADNSAGSFGTRRHSLQVGTGKIGPGFSAEARLSRIASDGYIDRAASSLYSYLAVVRYQGARGFAARLLHTSGREQTYQTWYGLDKRQADTARTRNTAGTDFGQRSTPYLNEIDNYRQDYWQLHLSKPLSAGWRLGGALFYTQGQGYYEQYKVQDALFNYGFQFRDSVPPPTDLVRRRWLRNHYFGATATLQLDTGRHSLVLGGLASRYLGQSFGRIIWGQSPFIPAPDYTYYQSNSTKQEASTFAKYTYTLPGGLSLYADMQLRALNYTLGGTESGNIPVAINRRYVFANPKAGLGYDAGGAGRLFLSVAVAHREPTRTTFTDTRGGKDPRPERLTDYELTYTTRLGAVLPTVTVFYMDYNNQLVQTGQLNDVGNAIFKNIARSYRRGIEAQASYIPTKNWVLSGSVTLSDNRLESYSDTLAAVVPTTFTRTPIAYSPALTAQGRISWQPFPQAEATLLGRYIGKQYLDNTGTESLSLPAYALADLRLAYQLSTKKYYGLARLTLQINNLTDLRYSNNGYAYAGTAYVFPQAGRNFLAGLLLSF